MMSITATNEPALNLAPDNRLRITSKRAVYGLTILVVAAIVGLPLFNLVKLSLMRFDLGVFDAGVAKVVGNTILIGIITMLLSLGLGTTLAFLLWRTNVAGKKALRSFLLYPYIIPSIITAIGWVILANPGAGLLKEIIPGINIYSFTGLIFVETLCWYTFVMLNVANVLENLDGSLEESARMCGASPLRIFFTITLPLLKPALIGSAILVFLCCVSSFAVPAVIGAPGKIFVLTTKIYQWIKIGTTNSILEAMVLSLPILVVAFVLSYMAEKWLGRKVYATLSGKHNRKLDIQLRAWRVPLTLILTLFAIIAIGMPLATILFTSLMKVYGSWELSLENYRTVLFRADTLYAIRNSFLLAIGGGLIVSFLSFFLAYYKQKTHYRGRNLLVTLAALPYAAPGTILAMAILFSLTGYSPYLLLLLAYVAKHINHGIRIMGPAIINVDKSLEEASLMCGASWIKTLGTIWLPVLAGALSTCTFLLIAPLFSEVTMSIMLSGPEAPTVGIRLFHLQEYESPPLASVLAMVILVLVIGLNMMVKKLSKGKLGV